MYPSMVESASVDDAGAFGGPVVDLDDCLDDEPGFLGVPASCGCALSGGSDVLDELGSDFATSLFGNCLIILSDLSDAVPDSLLWTCFGLCCCCDGTVGDLVITGDFGVGGDCGIGCGCAICGDCG